MGGITPSAVKLIVTSLWSLEQKGMETEMTALDRIDARLNDTYRETLVIARQEIVDLTERLKLRGKLLSDIFNADGAEALPLELRNRMDDVLMGRN